MTLVLTILSIVIAAICKALADTLDQHFDTSIFRDSLGWPSRSFIIRSCKNRGWTTERAE
jgi:hypothetical protein